jgi:hypothetical protein
MDKVVTSDLSKFGYREMDIAADLFKLYATGVADFLGSGVTVMFNTKSGFVFLTDEDFNVAVLSDDKTRLIQWFNCPNCGEEGSEDTLFSIDEHGCTAVEAIKL